MLTWVCNNFNSLSHNSNVLQLYNKETEPRVAKTMTNASRLFLRIVNQTSTVV